ncbi:uroporphyrinogen-III C-methyltransferase [Staphylococcus gallinarum]|uniref:uroporphyrinogen-III C-methyltransferase n=1 Tax=Staphylococcus gallinarum TaxID=1293 RepID=A0A3A0VSL9_STAGA|nr:uroporphyrinogen-III C-methyltransferase [Staphylococcus gallinarum]RIP37340.1 uroporphyrinogen-III C-methyltransferase [Staphylococcus gallinarum]
MSVTNYGKVYLIGAGPGNPSLVTRRAEQLIKKADVILYDRLVNPFMLQLARPEIPIIDVGKLPYSKHIKQDEINELLVTTATKHSVIIRLKGGDPAVFGRVYEEVQILTEMRIPYEIVPGITSSSAAIAQLGLGFTIRNIATSVTYTTGHFKDSTGKPFDITGLLNNGTLAIYMGIRNLESIMQEIYSKTHTNYPVVVCMDVTGPTEQYVKGTVLNIVSKMDTTNNSKPGLIIVGNIVDKLTLKEDLTAKHRAKYLIRGSRNKALEKAFELYEQGDWCMIYPDEIEQLHPSQQLLIESHLAQSFDRELYVDETCSQ